MLRVAGEGKKRLHLVGLISDEGVHSHISHLFNLLKVVKTSDVDKVFVHGITDGNSNPKSTRAKELVSDLVDYMEDLQVGSLATLVGSKCSVEPCF